jgi:hypothetical protein
MWAKGTTATKEKNERELAMSVDEATSPPENKRNGRINSTTKRASQAVLIAVYPKNKRADILCHNLRSLTQDDDTYLPWVA